MRSAQSSDCVRVREVGPSVGLVVALWAAGVMGVLC